MLLTGCTGRDLFGWQTDLWGNPYPPDPVELEAKYAEMELLRHQAETLRVNWQNRKELKECAQLYEQVLQYQRNKVKDQLETYFEGLAEADQAKHGTGKRQSGESDEDFNQRSQDRYSALREAANLPFDGVLYEIYWKLSNNYYLLAEQLTDDADADEKLALYEKGLFNGELGLDSFLAFREKILAGEEEEVAVLAIGKVGIEAIYWTAVNLGKWSRQRGFSTILLNKDKARAMIERVRELDDHWYYGAADRYLGGYYAVAPAVAGGDLEKSKLHFDRSIEIAPHYWGTHVLVAEYYATKMMDEELFETELQIAIDGDMYAYPDIIPIQRIEKKKAEAILANRDEYF